MHSGRIAWAISQAVDADHMSWELQTASYRESVLSNAIFEQGMGEARLEESLGRT